MTHTDPILPKPALGLSEETDRQIAIQACHASLRRMAGHLAAIRDTVYQVADSPRYGRCRNLDTEPATPSEIDFARKNCNRP